MVSIRQIEKGEPERIAAAKKRAGEPPNQTRTNYTPATVKPAGQKMAIWRSTGTGLPSKEERDILFGRNTPTLDTDQPPPTPNPAPKPTPSKPQPLQWRDSNYNAQIASIQRALQDYETGAQKRGDRYGIDYTTGLNKLGYRPGSDFTAMPNLLETPAEAPRARALMSAANAQGEQPLVQPVSGAFDIEGQYDPFSTAARGTRSTRDDFAARGTLRSSDFAKNFADFQNRLQEQLTSMETGRSRFAEDLATDIAQQRTSATEREQQAQRDAQMRAAINAASAGGFA